MQSRADSGRRAKPQSSAAQRPRPRSPLTVSRDNGPTEGLEMLGKAMSIVHELADGKELSVAALAECTGEPVSSTYRLVSSLLAVGWIAPGLQRGRYRLGLYFLGIGSVVEDRLDLRERIRPALQRLRDRSNLTAHLCVRDGARAVCIDRIDAGEVRELVLRPGKSLPLVVGGAPMAILANLPPHEYESVRDLAIAQSEVEGFPRTAKAVDQMVNQTRLRGYAVSDNDVTPGIAALSTPVFDYCGQIAAAISIAGLREHVLGDSARDNAIAAIVDCGREASLALGWRGEPQ